MKKVGIITIINCNNYGAELQAFALQYKINKLGYESEIIDYLYYKNRGHKRTNKSKPFVKLSPIQKLKEAMFPVIADLKSLPYYRDKKERANKFSDFHKKNTQVSRSFKSIEELYEFNKHPYEIFVVGSDQVWNPYSNTNLEPYFLTFAPDNKRKISYASSFGVDNIPDEYHSYYKDYLSNLDSIAVREKAGVSIVKSIADKEINWVVDPTLLLSPKDWENFAVQPKINDSYLLLYVLNDSDYIDKLAIKIASELNLKIVRICKNASKEDKAEDILNIIDAGPSEFLGWFLNADFVLTTSFHGVCFSLNFNKSFYSILKRNKLNNSRQIGLLSELDLESRILYVDEKFPEQEDYAVNFKKVNQSLIAKIDESANYLVKALSE